MSIASRAGLVERVRAEFERTLYNRTDNRTSTEVIVDSTLAAVVEMLEALEPESPDYSWHPDAVHRWEGVDGAREAVRALQAPAPEPERAEGERG